MNPRKLIATTVGLAMLAAMLWGGTPDVGASPNTSQSVDTNEADDACQTDITVTNYDAAHKQVGRLQRWTAEAQAACVDVAPTAMDNEGQIIQPKESLTGHIYPPSDPSVTCRTVDVARSRYSSFGGTLLFMYHHVQRWCWGLTTVFPQTNTGYFTNLDPLQQVDKQIDKADDYFYKYGWNNPLSGWYSLRGGHSHVAVFWYRMDYYPYVKIWAHGDGSANWERGD